MRHGTILALSGLWKIKYVYYNPQWDTNKKTVQRNSIIKPTGQLKYLKYSNNPKEERKVGRETKKNRKQRN